MAEELKEHEESLESPEKQYPVKRICSWCGKEMGDANFTSSKEGQINHGICPECEKKVRGDIPKKVN